MLLIIQSIIMGILSTIFMDIVAWLREKVFQIKPLNYSYIGRWFLSWKDGQFIHENIFQSSSKIGERCWGWGIHYLTGILWVFLYLIFNKVYSFDSNFISILIFSLCTTLVPFIIMQPALGFGFFATKTPNPLISIKNSLIAHVTFGIGLYLSSNFLMAI